MFFNIMMEWIMGCNFICIEKERLIIFELERWRLEEKEYRGRDFRCCDFRFWFFFRYWFLF